MNQTRARVLEFIKTYIAQHTYGPTIREIAAGVGTAPSNAQRHVVKLAQAGQIVKRWHHARSIRLPTPLAQDGRGAGGEGPQETPQ